MIRKVPLFLIVALAAVVNFSAVPWANAIDRFWDFGAGTTNWGATAGANQNWSNNFTPEAAFNERGVVGTDRVGALLDATTTITTGAPPVGGIALGFRERVNGTGAFVNTTAPAAGSLIGRLTISGGIVNSRTTAQANFAADGRVLVGVDGRGYLTMTGGTLNATRLVVDGENLATGEGRSRVDLSGSAAINISNAQNLAGATTNNAAENIATFARDLRITGPNVTFNTFGRLTLAPTNAYQAEITSPTAHSTLRTTDNIAVVGGTLAVNFSGAGSSGHAFGQTWNLVDSPLAIAGSFSGLGVNSEIAVTGLTTPNPLGTAYRVRKTSDGTGETVQLVYDRYLVLRVNRDTGELSVRNPHGGPIQIDGYTVSSPLGSLLTSYSGISGQVSPPNAGWFKPVDGSSQPLNTVNALTEIKSATFGGGGGNPTFNVTSIPSFTIGNGFSKTAVGANVNNFGIDGEDVSFSYSTPSGVITGHVEYIGTKFENNMVLRVNSSGNAFLKNDSLETLTFDGYSITSSTGSLVGGAAWTGLSAGAGWQKSPATASALSQTNPTSSSTLAPGAELALGDIGSFTTAAQQGGLALKFILSEGLIDSVGPTAGDFDSDGDVDGRDFLVWQRGGSPAPLSAADLLDWQTNYGGGGGGTNPPETTFRIGSVVFDNPASVAAVAAVPEPSTAVLMFSIVIAVVLMGRHKQTHASQQYAFQAVRGDHHVGAQVMSRRLGWCALVLGMCASQSASAVTQGIPLVNNRFELPGPVGTKTVAFDATGVPIPGIIPGWTFSGPGVELFGDTVPGDSGTEDGGNPGNDLLLSTLDGTVYQTGGGGFTMGAIPATQQYLFSFDAHEIFIINADNTVGYNGQGRTQIKARFYYGASRTTLTTLTLDAVPGAYTHYELVIPSGSPLIATANGQSIGIEFDNTSIEFNTGTEFDVQHSWVGIDNVIMEIAGVLPGDFDGNGSITLSDYNILRDNLEESHDFLADGDIVRDGFVDLNDFRAWKSLPGVISSGVLAQIAAIPEPSSMVLILASTALAGAFSRRRFGISRRVDVLAVAFISAWAFASSSNPASAAVLYYDPFNTGANPAAGQYEVGPLVPSVGAGQNPTVGPTPFFTGPWEVASADVLGTTVQEPGLSFLGSPAAGGSLAVSVDENNVPVSSRAGRHLTTPWTATTTGTFYISYMMSFGGVGVNPASTSRDDVGHRAMEMWTDTGTVGSDASLSFRVGYMSFNGNFNSLPPSQAPLKAGPNGGAEVILEGGPASFLADNGATHLIVLKFTLSDQDASDIIQVFLDPTENEEPIIASAAFFNQNFTLGSMSGPIQFGGVGTTAAFDELRVADTFIDVLPDFPMKGDTNGDDLVNQLDYQAIVTHMNLTGQSTANGDVTGDGRVDLRDLRLWRDNRTDIPGLEAVGEITVPEPTSFALALLGSLAMFGRGRRRPV